MDRLTANRQRTTNALLAGDNFLQSWKVYRNEIRKKCQLTSQGQTETQPIPQLNLPSGRASTLSATGVFKELQSGNQNRAASPLRQTRTVDKNFFSPLRRTPNEKEYEGQGSPSLNLSSQASPRRERTGARLTVNLRDIYKMQDAIQGCDTASDLSAKCQAELKSLAVSINKLLTS